ncbi:60S ribosomal protein L28 [Wallemia ichthyophaga EXF-994]|uniref:60S ribosomal protein L28 n=1 Tax=Wallemia ichthyophaga (strain EXF-994 / CBS 113033) TaxID=1299270 RepID=R9ARX0_WALI9|nr:60S ribosomal protein L28 [Wallemia ichthyophaga EXF-994]EOR02801.1 60S ribosomal protein L28 [Wallemia ichthyophaga EXF-994]
MVISALLHLSGDLQWLLLRKSSSFIRPSAPGSHKLSSEPGNLLANHSYKYSSTINGQKALGVNPHDKGAVIVARKTKAPVNQWNKGFAKTQVTGGKRRAYKSTANVVATTRPDLVKPAVAKVSAIYASKGQKKDAPAKKVRGKKAQAPLPAPKAE